VPPAGFEPALPPPEGSAAARGDRVADLRVRPLPVPAPAELRRVFAEPGWPNSRPVTSTRPAFPPLSGPGQSATALADAEPAGPDRWTPWGRGALRAENDAPQSMRPSWACVSARLSIRRQSEIGR
jgi:hypothetical protein